MKRILIIAFLMGSLGASATQIKWIGTSGANWNTASNWQPASVPTSADEALFNTNGALVTLDFTTGLIIGKLTVSDNVTFQTAANRTLNVGSNSFTSGSNVFTVAANKSLTLQSTATSVGITITLVTGYKGAIAGTVNLSAGVSTTQNHKLTTPDVGGLTFQNGSICNTTSVSGSNPFGTGTDGGVVFASGSLFVFKGGSTPFGSSATCSFQTGSKFSFQYVGGISPTGAGKTYADFEYNTSSTLSLTSASAICTIDNLTIMGGGTLNLAGLTSSTTISTITIKKSISIASGSAMTIGNATGSNTGGFVLNFSGTTPTFTNSNASGGLTINSTGGAAYTTTINVNNGSTLTLNSNFDMSSGVGTGSRNFNVVSGGKLTVGSGATLSVTGTLANNGTIDGSGVVKLNGTANTVSGTGTINNLTIANGAGNSTTISSGMQSLTGILLVSSGTLNTGGFLTLKSTSITNTAVVDQVGVGAAISGNVIVERYIPKGWRAYRDIAPCVYNATSTLFSNWQEGGSYTSGKGIFITGVAGTSQSIDASGLDVTSSGNTSASLYTNNYATSSDNWSTITDTKHQILSPYKGYRVLVRGDRNFNLFTNSIPTTGSATDPNGYLMYSDTKVRSTGQLIYNNVSYSTGGVTNSVRNDANAYLNGTSTSAFSMIANPYVCPVKWGTGGQGVNDYTTVYGNSLNINGSYWYLDPTGGGTGYYRAFNANTGSTDNTYTNSDGSTSTGAPASQYIQPGQAVFVQNFYSTNPIVVFTESCKVASSAKASVFGISKPLSKIYLSLLKADGATVYVRKDAAAVAFAEGFTNESYGPQDAVKFANASDNLSIIDKSKSLSLDGRLPATATDVLPIGLNNLSGTNYQLVIDATNYSNGLSPYLVDSYKGTRSSLTNGVNTISFAVDAAISATYTNRFSIVFDAGTLPVNSIAASASLNNKIATISWNTVGEKNVSHYVVEKSTDAKSFATIGQSTAKNTATANYSTTDNTVTATTYYRIKAVSNTGVSSYSNVAKLSSINSQLSISLYPNPLKGKTLNVSIDNASTGKYTVSIYNALGQSVSVQTISHTGGSASHALTISNRLASGVYNVAIREEGSKQLVHQTTLTVQP